MDPQAQPPVTFFADSNLDFLFIARVLRASRHLTTGSAHRPTIHFVCNNGCNLFHTVSAMIFCPAAVGWI